jgi:TRAP-type C4-dicarboxylate transport system permease small subunit
LEQFLERCERAVRVILAGLLAFITLGVFIQVCMRYLFSLAFLWGEELSLFAFIWCVFLGAAIGVRRRIHFGFDLLAGLLGGRAAALQRLLVDLIVLGLSVVLLIQGYHFTVLSIRRLSPALGITLLIPTLIIPISAAYMILATGVAVVKTCRRIVRPDLA